MGKWFTELDEETQSFIAAQHMFFVATAPVQGGTVNCSPKGYDSLRVVNGQSLLYVDFHGSGNETAEHVRENGRITLMWCSFDRQPLILRVYGKGAVTDKASPQFEALRSQHYPDIEPGIIRQLFHIHIQSVQKSCGWGVPLMTFADERPTLMAYSKQHLLS